jgi:hypothetical protein
VGGGWIAVLGSTFLIVSFVLSTMLFCADERSSLEVRASLAHESQSDTIEE